MAIRAEFVNKGEIMRKIDAMSGPNARRVLSRTLYDLDRRVPPAVARIASSVYAMPRANFNPRTKAGGALGSLGTGGGTVASLTFVYRGQRIPLGSGGAGGRGFPLAGGPVRYSGSQTFTAQVLRGGMKPVGHWSKPWSEGGRYGAKSPNFILPGHGSLMRRLGRGTGGDFRGPSVPQMVLGNRTKPQVASELGKLLMERLEHNIGQIMG